MLHYFNDAVVVFAKINVALFDILLFDVALVSGTLFIVAVCNVILC